MDSESALGSILGREAQPLEHSVWLGKRKSLKDKDQPEKVLDSDIRIWRRDKVNELSCSSFCSE